MPELHTEFKPLPELRKAKHPPVGPLYYESNRAQHVRLRIRSGGTLQVDAEDALSGQIRTNEDRRDTLNESLRITRGPFP
jgi:hypothetical protein